MKSNKSKKSKKSKRQTKRHIKQQNGGWTSSDWGTSFYGGFPINPDINRFTNQNNIISKPDHNYLNTDNFAKLNDPFSMVAAPYPFVQNGGIKKTKKSKKKIKLNKNHKGGGSSQWGSMFYNFNDPNQYETTLHDNEKLFISLDEPNGGTQQPFRHNLQLPYPNNIS